MRTIAAAFALIFVLAVPAVAQPTAEELARPPAFSFPALSPSGRYASFVVTDENGRKLTVFDLANGAAAVMAATLDDDDVRNFEWVGDSYLVFGRRSVPENLSVRDEGVLVRPHGFSLAVLDVAERKLTSPFKKIYPAYAGSYGQGYFRHQDDVLHVYGDGPKVLLRLYESKSRSGEVGWPSVIYADLSSGARSVHEAPSGDVKDWMTDRAGRLRVEYRLTDTTESLRVLDIDSGDWRDVGAAFSSPLGRFSPVGFADDPHTMYVVSNHEGEPGGLYPYDTRTGRFGAAVASHPVFEIQGAHLNPSGDGVLAAFAGDLILPIDPDEKAYYAKVAERFPGKRTAVVGVSRDRTVRIVFVGGADDPGGYHIYREATGTFEPFGRRAPWLDARALATTSQTAYEARDGLPIQAFVTLPVGAEASGLPFVVLPHGGPASRDSQTYDPLVQWLAANGYGVLQMNFRGSEGFGVAFEELGAGQWGRAMQDDVADGAAWLVAQGVADPGRICIAGWSYGGYAALMGAARHGDQFACAASIAGVTDLQAIIRSTDNDVITRRIGRSWRDRESLRVNSPVNRADDISIPVFVAHGRTDDVVPYSHAVAFARAMEKAKKPTDNIVFPLGDHDLDQAGVRERLYVRLTEFLNAHIGG